MFRLCLAGAAFLFLCLLLWGIGPAWVTSPIPALGKALPIRTYLDEEGRLLWYERTWDLQWRDPVPLEQVSPRFLSALLAAEDARFRQHHGVDYRAIFRALFGNLRRGKIHSGASTITMQLVALPRNGRRKNLRDKLRQAMQARAIERKWSKEKILEEYVNRLPFGGKIYGIQTAAVTYFGKNARDLTWAEATLLAGIPQRPNALRPDRHLPQARLRQKQVLQRLVECGILSRREAENIADTPVLVRDTTQPSRYELFSSPRQHSPALADLDTPAMVRRIARPPSPEAPHHVPTTLRLSFQHILYQQLLHQTQMLPGVTDAAGVILHVPTGNVLAAVGTLHWDAPAGQYNVLFAYRAAGSTLKPFLYEQAIRGGRILPDTILPDTPMRYGTWSPVNYDGTWQGDVTARQALAASLNIPAIRLLQELTPGRFLQHLQEWDICPRTREDTGLSLILGTAACQPLQLADAYARMAREATTPPFSPSAVLTLQMMRTYPLPETRIDAAWKTGTSNGLHDAWCFACTPEYCIGVWLGNKSGIPSASLIGLSAAAPVAGRILQTIQKTAPDWSVPGDTFCEIPLCRKSGLTPSPACQELRTASAIPGYRLPTCKTCVQATASKGEGAAPAALQILSPKPVTYKIQPGSMPPAVSIPLRTNRSASWFVDSIPLPAGTESFAFPPGPHTIHAITDTEAASVHILVR